MGIITALKNQTKNPNRINVHLNGSYCFAVDRAFATDLKVGNKMSDEEIEALKKVDMGEHLFQRAKRLIDRRPRAERELIVRFEQERIPQDVQQAVVRRLKDQGLIDDHAFTEAWIENRQVFRPRSARALRMELRQKGVSGKIIEQHLADFDDEQAAYAAAIKGARRYRSSSRETYKRRLSAYLLRRGFDHSTISSVVTRIWRETSDCEVESEDMR